MPYQDEEINRMCKKQHTRKWGAKEKIKNIQQHLFCANLDHAKFGSCKASIANNLD